MDGLSVTELGCIKVAEKRRARESGSIERGKSLARCSCKTSLDIFSKRRVRKEHHHGSAENINR